MRRLTSRRLRAVPLLLVLLAGGSALPGLAAAGAPAGGTVPIELEDLSWTELRDAVQAGSRTVLLPIGGTEQSGPYLTLGKHNVRVRALAERIARGLGHTLVAPVLAYVPEGNLHPPSGHMRFPGTLSVPETAFAQVLEAAAESLRVHGFTHVVLLGDHGGYQRVLEQVVQRLNAQWRAGGAQAVAPAAYYAASSQGFAALLRSKGYAPEEIGSHAGLADASLQLALAPETVRLSGLQRDPAPAAALGVYGGDARRASAELGRLGVDLIVSRTIEALRQAGAGG